MASGPAKTIYIEGDDYATDISNDGEYARLLESEGIKCLITTNGEAGKAKAIYGYAGLENHGKYKHGPPIAVAAAKAPLAWPRNFGSRLPSVAEVLELKSTAPHAVHTYPVPRKFVGRTQEAKDLIKRIESSGFKLKEGPILKMQNPAFEYSTISGAGKSTWGFHIESVLKKAFPDCIISRVSLNFGMGTGAGSDNDVKREADVNFPLARVLFARGCLETAPENVEVHCSTSAVLDLLCQLARQGHDPNTRLLLYIHLDEAAFLGGNVAKCVINALLEYNLREERLGWVVPVITHTCPLNWPFNLGRFPLERLFLSPLTLDELRDAAGWTPELNADRLLSCTGGHASMLTLLLNALPQQPKNKDQCADGRKALFENELVDATVNMFGKLVKESQLAVLTAIFRQSHIEPDDHGNWPSPYADLWAAGVLFCNVDPTGTYATISMPLPALLPCLSLCVPLPEYLDRKSAMFDPAKAFEVLVTLWAASEYSEIEHFIGEVANFKALQEQKKSAFAVTQAKIDGAGDMQPRKRKPQGEGEKIGFNPNQAGGFFTPSETNEE